MPYRVSLDFGVAGLGVPLSVHDDAFWRPFYLCAELTADIVRQKPEPLYSGELQGRRPPDIFSKTNTWIVRESVKDVVESLEPGLHAFVPLNVITQESRKDLGVFYAMKIQNIVDAVVVEGSDYNEGPGIEGREKSLDKEVSILGQAALDPSKLHGEHLWRQHGGFGAPTFCSDAFHDRIKKAKARGWRFKPCRLGTAKDFENYSW